MKHLKLTEEQEFRILQTASSMFLSKDLPDNWEDLEDKERDAFLEESAWHLLENQDVSYVWEKIEDASYLIQRLFGEITNL